MNSIDELQEEISPHWDQEKLENVLNPDVEMKKWKERKQRELWREGVKNQGGNFNNLREIIASVVRWDNGEAAICLWSGYIIRADEKRSQGSAYNSPKDVEASLIKRIGTPAYVQYEYTKSELAQEILPIISSSAITQLRPNFWKSNEKSLERVKTICEDFVNENINHYSY